MIKQNPAQLFKAHTRSQAENETHRLHATFNFNELTDALSNPFGALTVLNDETLAANKTIERILPPCTVAMVLPLVGAAECHFTRDITQIVVPGEGFTYYTPEEGSLSIKNPYEDSHINFLYITFSATIEAEVLLPKDFLIAQADLTVRNKFHKLFESFQSGLSAHIGIFNGRSETAYIPCNKANGIFVFVISGTFEVQGRTIEERDGLALWDTEEIDIDALSENAILLLIEAPLTGFNAI